MLWDRDIMKVERRKGERQEREEGRGPTYCLVVSLTVGQAFLLIVPATFEWFLTVRTHKMLEDREGRGGE